MRSAFLTFLISRLLVLNFEKYSTYQRSIDLIYTFFFLSANLLAISLILSVLDTELPPYFCTTTLLNFIPPENSLLT